MTLGPEEKRLREIWRSMRKRCENRACKDYPHYGGRGIRVCREWQDFYAFRDWALANGYRNDLTLDRVCNSKGYAPWNCRWISRKAQSYNRGTNTRLKVGRRMCTIEEWADEKGLLPSTIIRRLERGWSPEEAVMTPNNSKRKKK